MTDAVKRKLIEVALPLEAINRESVRENYIYRGNPSSIHKWFAQRPLAACRAVLFAQLVDDPSSYPDRFPTLEEQAVERKRLFDLIERLVVWENGGDKALLRDAHAEIAACFDGKPPAIHDPFAGGGSIPLEAQRLGLEVHASDLNPVAVLINKALIEIPPRWAGRPPVFPGAAGSRLGGWTRATGLAEDVRCYGQWIRDEAERRVGHLYPKATLADGSKAKVIAWIWARTVTCANPACRATMPLIGSLWLSKKKARPTWLQPVVDGKGVTFDVVVDKAGPPDPPKKGRGAKFACLVCSDINADAYIKAQGMLGRMGTQLLAVVAETQRQRIYLPATEEHIVAADIQRPNDVPEAELANDPRAIWCIKYGLTTFADLFTNRQLVTLTTLSDLVIEARLRVIADARNASWEQDASTQRGDDIATYLAFVLSKVADYNCTAAVWYANEDRPKNLFARQGIPMVWDFPEVNPLGEIGGTWEGSTRVVVGAIAPLGFSKAIGTVTQADAMISGMPQTAVISTDPPYYDNIGYADLADFFYVWLRRSLRNVHPALLGTLLTPKVEELVAIPYRFAGSKAKAEEHFETGFVRTFTRIRKSHPQDVPVTVFYAFKQAEEDDEGVASTGWETMLNALMQAGLSVTATWPMRTERFARSVGIGTNALASSIILSCRPRSVGAEATTRRGFIQTLRADLPRALRELQQGSIAPVDLAQASIGPGMAVFSGYRSVVEADGSSMTVRTALALINQVLDEVLSEQEGDFDADTRFCVKWFSQYGWEDAPSGTADTLSRATNTSVAGLVRGGVFRARAGRARLIAPEELSAGWNPGNDERVSAWEVVVRLAHALGERGGDEAARLMALAGRRVDLDIAKELAYLLFSVCERRGWTQSALLFNGLGTSWSDLTKAARGASAATPTQGEFTLERDEEE